jgi:fucose permease
MQSGWSVTGYAPRDGGVDRIATPADPMRAVESGPSPDTIEGMTAPLPASGTDVAEAAEAADRVPAHALRAGLVAGAAYALIGWRGLLVPSLILLVEPTFDQTDAGLGAYFLATALAYAAGSLFGGRLIRVRGARLILPSAALLMAAGLLAQGFTGTWLVFALAGIVVSVGASTADVGINALVLDLFPHARGRALNLLHVAYGVGALSAPLLIAFVIGAGVPWSWVMTGTGVAVLIAAAALALTLPSTPVMIEPARDREGVDTGARRLPRFLLVLAVATGCYVAAEAGVSDWLVRYLHTLPFTLASTALTLFWGGIAAGRLVFARIGNRLEPQATASGLAIAGAVLLAVAVLVPVSPVSPILFGAVGLAFGPIFPLIVAAAGGRMPGRSATVTGTLIFAAVVGAVIYPPAIGFMSVTVGLQVALGGAAVLAFVSGIAAWAARRVGE